VKAVVWVDPGLSTGFAAWDFETGQLWQAEAGMMAAGEAMTSMVRKYGRGLSVGIERYTITERTAKLSPQPEALLVTGIVQYVAWTGGCELLPSAAPADRLLAQDGWLKALGWWPQGMADDDALSATKHLLAWMLRTRNLPSKLWPVLFTNAPEQH
jgi:hypothetical protein